MGILLKSVFRRKPAPDLNWGGLPVRVRKPRQPALEQIAGDRVADRQREEAEPDGDQDEIQHLHIPCDASFSGHNERRKDRVILRAQRTPSRTRSAWFSAWAPNRCHLSRMFSRWNRGRSYRNPIKIGSELRRTLRWINSRCSACSLSPQC